MQEPRLRQKKGPELTLPSYLAFQQNGCRQQAAARQRNYLVSPRSYARALDDWLAGSGIAESSVSCPWKAAPAAHLQHLGQRPVPADLVVLCLDSQYFRRECLVGAQGHKHVLGLCHGATDNATLVSHSSTTCAAGGSTSRRRC